MGHPEYPSTDPWPSFRTKCPDVRVSGPPDVSRDAIAAIAAVTSGRFVGHASLSRLISKTPENSASAGVLSTLMHHTMSGIMSGESSNFGSPDIRSGWIR